MNRLTYRHGLTLTGRIYWTAMCIICILLIFDYWVEHMTGQCSRFWEWAGNDIFAEVESGK